jgi:hypothetical protein
MGLTPPSDQVRRGGTGGARQPGHAEQQWTMLWRMETWNSPRSLAAES